MLAGEEEEALNVGQEGEDEADKSNGKVKKGKGKGLVAPSWGMGKGMNKGKMQQMMQMMMQMSQAFMKPDKGAGGDWKNHFQTALQRSTKKTPSKDELSYVVTEVTDGKKGYQAVLTVAGTDYTGEVALGKKEAEHQAAKVAMEAMFPKDFAKVGMSGMSSMDMSAMMATGAKQGTKRKAEEQDNAKSRLNHALPFILERTQSRTDLVFEVDESGEGATKYTATCSLPAISKSFTGEPKGSKKEAEDAAAEAAYEGTREQWEPLLAAHKEKKQKASKESLAALKKRHEEKKLEKEAAKEAAKAATAD